jgi:hypothetical protein
MTRFLLSHNLQVVSDLLPALTAEDLATGLAAHAAIQIETHALCHPHWLIQLEADMGPTDLAETVVLAWRSFRGGGGATETACQLLALGGRKDEPAGLGAALQQGDWGVDVVETMDAELFLQSIQWDLLKQGRAADAVFEIRG